MVSMPSRASTSLLHCNRCRRSKCLYLCQCPHGLVPHCYRQLLKLLICSHLSVSMPSRASTSLLLRGLTVEQDYLQVVSMPSRASTSLLQYPFKNLGFMRFPEPVFAGIYQNILTIVVFRAC